MHNYSFLNRILAHFRAISPYSALSLSGMLDNDRPPIPQDDPCQGDLSTLANVVTSLAHLHKAREMSDSTNDLMGMETLSNGDSSMTDIQGDEQTASDITR